MRKRWIIAMDYMPLVREENENTHRAGDVLEKVLESWRPPHLFD